VAEEKKDYKGLCQKMLINMHLCISLWERTWHCSRCYGCDALESSLVTLVLFVEGKKKRHIGG